jgi:periplasmic divalent cation tolerance protein
MAESTIAVVLVTAPSAQVAELLVRSVVEERLAACGNIVPGVVSIYRWQGAVQRDDEVFITFKTPSAATDRLMRRVQELHPYDVPEIVVLPVADALPAYAQWVVESCSTDGGAES